MTKGQETTVDFVIDQQRHVIIPEMYIFLTNVYFKYVGKNNDVYRFP